MMQSIVRTFLAGLLMMMVAAIASAQDAPQWKVGDQVEVLNLSGEWVSGKILDVNIDSARARDGGPLYSVKLDDPHAANDLLRHKPANEIRARGGRAEAAPQAAPPRQAQQPAAVGAVGPAGSAFKVGDLVDTFYSPSSGHDRGAVIEVGDRRYKVHYRGCGREFDEWVDASLVQPAATLSPNAPEVAFLFGRWRTTTVAVGGNYALWAHTPGIEINPDGTYVWKQTGGKPPVKGRWRADAKIPKRNEGTQKFDGVIVKDEDGNEWKVFKWVFEGADKQDRVELDRLCSGMSEVGSRVR